MDFTKYGLTPEQITELENAHQSELAKAIAPYSDYEMLKSTLESNNNSLTQVQKDLKGSKKLIEQLTEQLNDSLLDNAINKAFFDKGIKDTDLFSTQIDKTKISKGENGEFIGLQEQLDAVTTKYAHLINKEPENPLKGSNPSPSQPQPKPPTLDDMLKDFSPDKWQEFISK